MDKVKILDHEELVRDMKTQAVLNRDMTSLEAYRARRDSIRRKDEEVKSLREDIDQIKELLTHLVEKIK